MSERYYEYEVNRFACRDCGAKIDVTGFHDAFHDRIDRLEARDIDFDHMVQRIDRLTAVLLQRDREEMGASADTGSDDGERRQEPFVYPGERLIGSIVQHYGGFGFVLLDRGGDEFASGTAPTVLGVVDMLGEYLLTEYGRKGDTPVAEFFDDPLPKTRITEADLEQHARDMFGSGNPDTPPSAENPDKPYGNSGSMNRDAVFAPPKDAVLLCSECGEPTGFSRLTKVAMHTVSPQATYDHAATLTPSEPTISLDTRCRCGDPACIKFHDYGFNDVPTEPPVGSGWFADKWPGVLWMRTGRNSEYHWRNGDGTYRLWPDLIPGRPAVPGGER